MSDSTVPATVPNGHFFNWQSDLLALHIVSEILIALAYFSIVLALMYFLKRRPDSRIHKISFLIAAFLLAGGATHLLNSWNFWFADYWLSGFAKAITAILSVSAAILLWKWLPIAIQWPSSVLLKQANKELQHEINLRHDNDVLLQEAFDNAPIGKALVALNGDWIKVNQALCNILGYTKEDMIRINFQSITHVDDLDEDLQHVQDLIEGRGDVYQMEKRYKHKLGHTVWVLLSVRILRETDRTPRYFIAQILDITARKLAEEELQKMRLELESRVEERTRELEIVNHELQKRNELLNELSSTDPLTQLHNRRSFDIKIDELIYEARRHAYEFCVVLVDIDHFKTINDTYGHLKGDEVICYISSVLKNNIRYSDVAARLGGDEFCILLAHTSINRAPEIAENIRLLMNEARFTTETGETFTVTCSLGIAQYDNTMLNGNELLKKADNALYLAKHHGRNCVRLYSPITSKVIN